MLRPYQLDLKAAVYKAWADKQRNVLAVAPTGSGKTVLFSDILREYKGASCAIAHRQELVSQVSVALARCGVRHSILAPQATVKMIIGLQMADVGRSYYEPSARCRVAGVDTLIRLPATDPWLAQVGLWVLDEAHHLTAANKWGTAVEMFPNAHGLGVTATPTRADGKGLGRHADGLIDAMVVGPSMRSLITDGYLTPYRVFCPPSDLDLSDVGTSAGGDFSPEPLRRAVHKSHIVGDVVQHYLKIAPGKLGITFAVDIESATEIAAAYRAAGVPAEVISSKTPDVLRAQVLRRFKSRAVLQLVNVDLFGEGFDLPAIEVVGMARPTMSYGLFVQQFGRALRLLDGKEHGIIIDHVGNTIRHGLPDAPRVWTLDRREKRASKRAADVIPVKSCVMCASVFERTYSACPFCGHYEEPAGRSRPEQVDGDLVELSEEALRRLRGEIDKPVSLPYGAAPEVVGRLKRIHRERAEAQAALRESMMRWGGGARTGHESRAQREFYHRFGVDVLSAMALNAADATELKRRIDES